MSAFLARNRLLGRHEVLKIIGPDLIEAETRKQYEQLVAEIRRREAMKKSSPPAN